MNELCVISQDAQQDAVRGGAPRLSKRYMHKSHDQKSSILLQSQSEKMHHQKLESLILDLEKNAYIDYASRVSPELWDRGYNTGKSSIGATHAAPALFTNT